MIQIEGFDLNLIRMSLAFSMLGIATFSDLKKREVHDMLWICFGIVAIVLFFIEFDFTTGLLRMLYSLIVAPVAFLLWRLGFFGGADALAILVLAVLAPLLVFHENQITPFTTITNAAVFSLVTILTNLIRNLSLIIRKVNIFEGFAESRKRKAIAVLLGYKARNPKYSFPIEITIGNVKKFDFSIKHAEKTAFFDEKDVWVTPGMPFLAYITAGFVFQVFFGDLIFGLVF